MSSAQVSEEEIRRLILAYQQYQSQAEALVRQINLAQLTSAGLDRAIEAVQAMDKAYEGQNMLVSIGSGSFIHAKLASKAKVVLNVGAGVSIEKTTVEASESLQVQKSEISEGLKKMNDVLSKLDGEIQKIQTILAQYEQQVQAKGGGQVV
ncbi:MAG: prefoldin subunit alpha [Methanotrichaceae archaeon]|nr:prefoldin subunit alpha [Methanotrichaceae archaeon]